MANVSASKFVNVIPHLIVSQGSGFELNGLLLSKNPTLPIKRVFRFESLAAVEAYFGSLSDEAAFADSYFKGYDGSTKKPSALLTAYYNLNAQAGWLRSAKDPYTLDTLKTITDGGIKFVIGGNNYIVEHLDFSEANSFSEIAQIAQTALRAISGAPTAVTNATIIYSSQFDEFIITAGASDATGSMGYALPPSASLTDLSVLFNESSGAVLSAGQPSTITLSAYMNAIKAQTQNWITFAKVWDYEEIEDLAFASWASAQPTRFFYIEHDLNVNSKNPLATNSFAQRLKANDIKFTSANYGSKELAAFVMGAAASIDYTQPNGKITFAYKRQSGQAITCDNDDDYDTLTGKGYNVYERDASANDMFTGYQRGTISGDYNFLDAAINHAWLNDRLQVSLRDLLSRANFLPYSISGLALIETAVLSAVERAKTAGVISAGVDLNADILSGIISETGISDIGNTLFAQGWYLYSKNPDSAGRAARQSPILKFYYCDGGSIQSIELTSAIIR